jgi:hypothetical protein
VVRLPDTDDCPDNAKQDDEVNQIQEGRPRPTVPRVRAVPDTLRIGTGTARSTAHCEKSIKHGTSLLSKGIAKRSAESSEFCTIRDALGDEISLPHYNYRILITGTEIAAFIPSGRELEVADG